MQTCDKDYLYKSVCCTYIVTGVKNKARNYIGRRDKSASSAAFITQPTNLITIRGFGVECGGGCANEKLNTFVKYESLPQ